MALGEPEVGEALDLVHDVVGDFTGDAARRHAHEEAVAHRRHAGPRPLRPHRLAQPVGFPRGEAGDVDRHLHELFLEQGHAERLRQALLEQRVRVRDRFLAVAAPQVRVHRTALDGSGPDQCHLDHEVVEALGTQARQRGHLRAALHLEHADGVGRAQQRVHLRFLRDRGDVDVDPFVLAHEIDGEVQHREHAQAEQVELHQARGRTVVLVPLEHRAVFHARPLDRAALGEWTVGHHHPTRVDAEVAREVEHLLGELQRQPRDGRCTCAVSSNCSNEPASLPRWLAPCGRDTRPARRPTGRSIW